MIKNWLSKSRQLVVKHNHLQDHRLSSGLIIDANQASSRISRFRKLGFAMGVALIPSLYFGPAVYYSDNEFTPLVGNTPHALMTPDRRAVSSDLFSSESSSLNGMAGGSDLVVVSQNDKNIRAIINALDVEYVPDFRATQTEDAFKGRDPLERFILKWVEVPSLQLFGPDTSRRATYKAAIDLFKSRAHAIKEKPFNDKETVCFVQTNAYSTFLGSHGLVVSLDDAEMDFAILGHELAHCQDRHEVLFSLDELPRERYESKIEEGEDYPLETLQEEVLADLTTTLLISSQTGNWDFLDHTMIPFRFSQQHDADHATYPWLEELKTKVDLSQIPSLNQKTAFEMASKLFREMDFVDHEKQGRANSIVSNMYDYITSGNKFENRFWDRQENLWSYLDASSPGEALQAIEDYGLKQMRHNLDHASYRTVSDSSGELSGLLSLADKHAMAFGDVDLKAVVVTERSNLEQKNTINFANLASAISHPVDLDAQTRYKSNINVVNQMAYAFGLNNHAGIAINPEFTLTKLPGHEASKHSLRERLTKSDYDSAKNGLD